MKDRSEALELAEATALEALEEVVNVMRRPCRNSSSKLAAAKLILDVAGVNAAEADKRHMELLSALRRKVSEQTYAEVIRALAGDAAVSGEPTADASGLQ